MPRQYTPAEALLDFLANPDVGELVAKADDAELRRLYASFLSRLSTLKNRSQT